MSPKRHKSALECKIVQYSMEKCKIVQYSMKKCEKKNKRTLIIINFSNNYKNLIV